jgi:hypothetical protein
MQLQFRKLLVVAMLAIAPASTAQAANDAFNVRRQWLTATPKDLGHL